MPERDHAQLGMPPAAIEVSVGQLQLFQFFEILPAQKGELVEECRQRASLSIRELREAIELIEGARLSVVQDDSCARDPIGAFSVNQVSHDIKGTPGLIAFVRGNPRLRKIAQQRVERRRRASQYRDGFVECERAPSVIGRGHRSRRAAAFAPERCSRNAPPENRAVFVKVPP